MERDNPHCSQSAFDSFSLGDCGRTGVQQLKESEISVHNHVCARLALAGVTMMRERVAVNLVDPVTWSTLTFSSTLPAPPPTL
jgi:hypothetical protein